MMGHLGIDRRQSSRPSRWKGSRCGILLTRIWSLIAYSDTTPTRAMLAMAALLWAVMLAYPGDTFTRPVYRYMAEVAGTNAELKWTIAWAIYGALLMVTIFSSKPRPWWALVVNSMGVMLTSSSVISVFLTLTTPLPASIAPDIVMAAAAAWVLVRTHVNSEEGWRDG